MKYAFQSHIKPFASFCRMRKSICKRTSSYGIQQYCFDVTPYCTRLSLTIPVLDLYATSAMYTTNGKWTWSIPNTGWRGWKSLWEILNTDDLNSITGPYMGGAVFRINVHNKHLEFKHLEILSWGYKLLLSVWRDKITDHFDLQKIYYNRTKTSI